MAVDNLQAQTAVIGSMLIDESCVVRVLAAVDPRDFTSEPHRLAWQAARSLVRESKPVDPFAIRNVMGDGYGDFLRECIEVTPTSANVMEYIEQMHQQAALARIKAQAIALGSAQTLDACREAVKALSDEFNATSRMESWTLAELLNDFAGRHAEPAAREYLSYGLGPIDEGTYTERGDVVMIGGSPSDGKTAFALIAAAHMAQTRDVGFFSLETGREKLEDRLVASGFGIELSRIKRNTLTESDWDSFSEGVSEFSKRRLRIFRAAGATVDQIAWTAKAYSLDVVVIDYVQLITPEQVRGTSRAEQMAEVSRALHTFAQTSGTTVIELAQLTRQERGSNRERDMFDLSESSQFEKDADIIMLLYRPGKDTHFDESDRHSETLDPKKHRILRIAKNKEGQWGRFPLEFDGARQRFSIMRPNAFSAVQAAVRNAKRQRAEDAKQLKFEEIQETGDEPF
ncbi:MAG: AAA family ATPase [Oscillospiraceae bacterium]|nr:AAA family ATPase [Oscillospiraceae bacterium]